MGIIYGLLTGNTFLFLYERQVNIVQVGKMNIIADKNAPITWLCMRKQGSCE